jgi:hypothetical protein
LQCCVVARFRRRSDAEAHLQVLKRLIPNVTYTIIFDPTPEREDSPQLSDRSVPGET